MSRDGGQVLYRLRRRADLGAAARSGAPRRAFKTAPSADPHDVAIAHSSSLGHRFAHALELLRYSLPHG